MISASKRRAVVVGGRRSRALSAGARPFTARYVLAAAALLAPVFVAPNARAADEQAETEARTAARALAAQGSEAFEQRDFARALELFERASALVTAPTITLMQARTLVELGRLVEAEEKYEETRRMLDVDPTNSVFVDAASAAATELGPLLQRIPTLRVRLVGFSAKDNAQVVMDGKPLNPALIAVDRPVDPGTHRVEVRTAAGVVSRSVTVAEGAHEDVVLSPAPPPPAPVAEERAKPASSGSNVERVFGYALAGTGVALIGVGAVTGIMALQHKSNLDEVCHPGCPPSAADDLDAFRAQRTWSYIGFGVGVTALAGGGVLLWHSRGDAHVALSVSPRTIALAGSLP